MTTDTTGRWMMGQACETLGRECPHAVPHDRPKPHHTEGLAKCLDHGCTPIPDTDAQTDGLDALVANIERARVFVYNALVHHEDRRCLLGKEQHVAQVCPDVVLAIDALAKAVEIGRAGRG